MRSLAALVLGFCLALVARPARADAPPRATVALVVGSNRGALVARPDLHFADDDAARYYETFRMLAADEDLVLVTRFDRDSERQYASLKDRARPPTREALGASGTAIAKRVRELRAAGTEVDFYFVYAGHGDVDRGRTRRGRDADQVPRRDTVDGEPGIVAADLRRRHLRRSELVTAAARRRRCQCDREGHPARGHGPHARSHNTGACGDMFRRRMGTWSLALAAVAVVIGPACAAQRAEGPLGVALGLSPDETARALREYDFCRRSGPGGAEEVFPQCDRPGSGFGDAWVVAHYRDGRLVKLARFERWADEARAEGRWNQLIEKRAVGTPPSQAARDRIFARQRIPERTRSWVAFSTPDALVGVYLLHPTTSDDPSILEELIPVDRPAATP